MKKKAGVHLPAFHISGLRGVDAAIGIAHEVCLEQGTGPSSLEHVEYLTDVVFIATSMPLASSTQNISQLAGMALLRIRPAHFQPE